jgi:hypothetical protein
VSGRREHERKRRALNERKRTVTTARTTILKIAKISSILSILRKRVRYQVTMTD